MVENTVTVTNGETVVALPDHFSGTVGSDEDMTVQVTPHSLATVAVVQRNTTHITIAADRDVSQTNDLTDHLYGRRPGISG